MYVYELDITIVTSLQIRKLKFRQITLFVQKYIAYE